MFCCCRQSSQLLGPCLSSTMRMMQRRARTTRTRARRKGVVMQRPLSLSSRLPIGLQCWLMAAMPHRLLSLTLSPQAVSLQQRPTSGEAACQMTFIIHSPVCGRALLVTGGSCPKGIVAAARPTLCSVCNMLPTLISQRSYAGSSLTLHIVVLSVDMVVQGRCLVGTSLCNVLLTGTMS